MDTLRCVAELSGHGGCVNRLAWSPDGSILASGSDDRTLLLWRFVAGVASYRMEPFGRIQTPHEANIFGVRFLPHTHLRSLASCAMDGRVCLHSCSLSDAASRFSSPVVPPTPAGGRFLFLRRHVLPNPQGGTWESKFLLQHAASAKSVDVASDSPHLVFSAAEDGLVCQVDLRVRGRGAAPGPVYTLSESAIVSLRALAPEALQAGGGMPAFAAQRDCGCADYRIMMRLAERHLPRVDFRGCRHSRAAVSIIRARGLPVAVTGIKHASLNPANPNYLLVAAGDPFLRVYDRRMLPPLASRSGGTATHGSICGAHRRVLRFAPLHLTADAMAFPPTSSSSSRQHQGGAVPLQRRLPPLQRMLHVTHCEWDAQQDGGASPQVSSGSSLLVGSGRHVIGTWHGDGVYVFDTLLSDSSAPVDAYDVTPTGVFPRHDAGGGGATAPEQAYDAVGGGGGAPRLLASLSAPRLLHHPHFLLAQQRDDAAADADAGSSEPGVSVQHVRISSDGTNAGSTSGRMWHLHTHPTGTWPSPAAAVPAVPVVATLCRVGEGFKAAGNEAFRVGTARGFHRAVGAYSRGLARIALLTVGPRAAGAAPCGCSATGAALLLTNRAAALLKRRAAGDAAAAAEDCQRALQMQPAWWKATPRLARALQAAGKPAASLRCVGAFLRAHQQAPAPAAADAAPPGAEAAAAAAAETAPLSADLAHALNEARALQASLWPDQDRIAAAAAAAARGEEQGRNTESDGAVGGDGDDEDEAQEDDDDEAEAEADEALRLADFVGSADSVVEAAAAAAAAPSWLSGLHNGRAEYRLGRPDFGALGIVDDDREAAAAELFAAGSSVHLTGGGGGGGDGGDGGSFVCDARRCVDEQLLCTRLAGAYAGATNVQTDIKEAAFWRLPRLPWRNSVGGGGSSNGGNGIGVDGYIVAGSDYGRAVVWDRRSGVQVAALAADEDVVNCVRPHPSLPLLATSGIESVIRLWAPAPADDADDGDDGGGGGGGGGDGRQTQGTNAPARGSGAPARCTVTTAEAALDALWGEEQVREAAAAAGGLGGGADLNRDLLMRALLAARLEGGGGEGRGAGAQCPQQ